MMEVLGMASFRFLFGAVVSGGVPFFFASLFTAAFDNG
jgi:hypothetical protein